MEPSFQFVSLFDKTEFVAKHGRVAAMEHVLGSLLDTYVLEFPLVGSVTHDIFFSDLRRGVCLNIQY